jgi:hypothetical protein
VATSPEEGAGNRRPTKIIAIRLAVLALPVGIVLIAIGCGIGAVTTVVVGAVLVVLGLLGVASLVMVAKSLREKDLALREPGIALVMTFKPGDPSSDSGTQQLSSELQIRLDTGHTVSGPYWAHIGPLDAARFHVGATLRCLVNPAQPDVVQVFPFASPGDMLPIGRTVMFTSARFKLPRR